MRADRLRDLETLVVEAAKRLKKLLEENVKLLSELRRLEEENGRQELELRCLKALGERTQRVRSKLDRLVQKLDKAVEAS